MGEHGQKQTDVVINSHKPVTPFLQPTVHNPVLSHFLRQIWRKRLSGLYYSSLLLIRTGVLFFALFDPDANVSSDVSDFSLSHTGIESPEKNPLGKKKG